MKMTVLEMVQSLLASLESDQVDSINDTQESLDLALMLRDLFFDIANDLSLSEHESLIELIASGDINKPVLMSVPTNVSSIDWIKYDCRASGDTHSNYITIEYLPFAKFLDMQLGNREATADVGSMNIVMNLENFDVLYRTDHYARWFTTVDDQTIIFDSYDNSVDSTLQKSKTMCMGRVVPTFTLEDTFIPPLNIQQFPYFLNRAKVRAFAERKQQDNREAGGEARRQKVILQKKGQTVSEGTPYDQLVKFGRRPVK